MNKNIFLIALTLIVLWGCGTTSPSVRETGVHYSKDTSDTILPELAFIKADGESVPAPFFGVLKTETGRTGAALVYQGGAGLAGLFAQVLTHAAIENAAQQEALKKAQEEADVVLAGYTELISKNTQRMLISHSIKHLNISRPAISIISPTENMVLAEKQLILESLPVFYMSQDQQSLVLDHQLKAYYKHQPDAVIYQNMAKAISKKQAVDENLNRWKANNGELFIQTTKNLHLSSLQILLEDMYKSLVSQGKDATHKYYIGNKKHYVRGKVLLSNCKHTAIRNLKGNILVIQRNSPETSLSCQEQAYLK